MRQSGCVQKMGLFYRKEISESKKRAKHPDLVFYVVKGSEAAIKKCLSTEQLQSQEVMEGMRLGDKLASQGLRILAVAFKVMGRLQYEQQKIWFESATDPEEIENTRFDRNMQWAGLVCNSDPLCPSVPRAVEQLALGKKIICAICTGDRLETTVYIARAAGIATKSSSVVQLLDESADALDSFEEGLCALSEWLDKEIHSGAWNRHKRDIILAVGPQAFTILLKSSEKDQRNFMSLFSMAQVTVLYRMTPCMKLEIAKMVQRFLDGASCAIGDGGNDRLLMQQADFGIGVAQHGSLRSMLAVYCDAVIPHFGMLPRLLHYHCVNADVRFQGLMQLNTVRSVIALICIALLAWLAGFSATNFMLQEFSFGTHTISLLVIYQALTALLMANYILFEQPLPSSAANEDVCSTSTKHSAPGDDACALQGLNLAWQQLWKYRRSLSGYTTWQSVLTSCWKGLSAGLTILLGSVGETIDEMGQPQGTFNQLGAEVILACCSLTFISALVSQRRWPWPSVLLHSIFIIASGVLVYLLANDVRVMNKGSLELISPLCMASWKLALLNNVLTTVIGILPDLLLRVISLCGLSWGSMVGLGPAYAESDKMPAQNCSDLPTVAASSSWENCASVSRGRHRAGGEERPLRPLRLSS